MAKAATRVPLDRLGYETDEPYPEISQPCAPRPHKPRQYVAYRTIDDMVIDGRLNESSWKNADWTEKFVHILFEPYKNPHLATRAKMVWDDQFLYFGGELEEPNLIANITENDAVIYRDNDFEIFLDVDDDTRNYVEIEFNALGTVWDLFFGEKGSVTRGRNPDSPPYNVEGIQLAVRTDGTINYPNDTDDGWTFECAIPWTSLQQHCVTGQKLNQHGTCLRVCFSRVQGNIRPGWRITDFSRVEGVDWLWSPAMVYSAHNKETYGKVLLSERSVIQAKDQQLEEAFPFALPPPPPAGVELGSMVRVKAGTYGIGPDIGDPYGAGRRGEAAVKAFLIDRYPVTVGEYAGFLNAGGHDEHHYRDMAHPDFCGIIRLPDGRYGVVPGRDLYPSCFVGLQAALAYAAWAGKRLPTETEWEVAARGSAQRTYPWGDEPLDAARANYAYHVGHTAPVGSYELGRTPAGVYDMCGGVKEWVQDEWAPYPWGSTPEAPGGGQIVRGGAWTTSPVNMVASHRDTHSADRPAPFVGFRCAQDAE
jgi:formylglycine-generating enzyme required for sulfatase activity